MNLDIPFRLDFLLPEVATISLRNPAQVSDINSTLTRAQSTDNGQV